MQIDFKSNHRSFCRDCSWLCCWMFIISVCLATGVNNMHWICFIFIHSSPCFGIFVFMSLCACWLSYYSYSENWQQVKLSSLEKSAMTSQICIFVYLNRASNEKLFFELYSSGTLTYCMWAVVKQIAEKLVWFPDSKALCFSPCFCLGWNRNDTKLIAITAKEIESVAIAVVSNPELSWNMVGLVTRIFCLLCATFAW